MCVCVCVSDNERWTAQQRDGSSVAVQWSPSKQEVFLTSEDYFPLYFLAPGSHTHTHTQTLSHQNWSDWGLVVSQTSSWGTRC